MSRRDSWSLWPSQTAIGETGLKPLHQNIHQQIILLAALEFVVFAAAPYVAALIRFAADPAALGQFDDAYKAESALFSVVLSLAALAMGLYSRRLRAGSGGLLLRFGIALLATFVIMAIIFYVVPALFLGRGLLGLSAVIAFTAFAAVRFTFARLCAEPFFCRRLLVCGTGRRVTGMAQLRRRSERSRFSIVGYLAVLNDPVVIPEELLIRSEKPLLELCEEMLIDEIVVGIDDRRSEFPIESLLACKLKGIAVTEAIDFLERAAGKIRLEALNSTWIIFGPGFSRSRLTEIGTRLLDIVGGATLFVLALPVMTLSAAAILAEDGPSKPILYRQCRVGRHGRRFELVKFRSMRVDAEATGGPRWAQKEDPRVTRIGKFLRQCRADELPQLWSVLVGDLSLVGPRPERPEFVEELERDIPYYRERHIVKPGLTGWAQLCYPYGASERDTREKLQYDLYYVKNRSVFFNLMILMQTVEVILLGKGGR